MEIGLVYGVDKKKYKQKCMEIGLLYGINWKNASMNSAIRNEKVWK